MFNHNTVNDVVEFLLAETIDIDSMKTDDFHKACETGRRRDKFWQVIEKKGYFFVTDLEKELQKKSNIKRFSLYKWNYKDQLLDDFEYTPFHVHGKESIDALILNIYPEDLQQEEAGRLAQYQNSESLVYLFEKLSSNSKYHSFLNLVYGECVYRKPEVLNKEPVENYFSTHINSFLHSALPAESTIIEKNVPLTNYCRSYGMGRDLYNFDTIESSIMVVGKYDAKISLHESTQGPNLKVAFTDWVASSNGEVIDKKYDFNNQDDLSLIKAVIYNNMRFTKQLETQKYKVAPPGAVFSSLFHAASGGGCAYCSFGNSLQARLWAWQSLCGLAGLDWKKGYDALIHEIKQCSWYILDPQGEWFNKIMDDVWIVCINITKEKINMIAATDAD